MIITTSPKKPRRQSISAKSPLLAHRYEKVQKLGQGGGGEVYLARDTRQEGQRVALKTVPLKKNTDPHLVSTLKNEFATLTLLSHRHLARVMDFGTTPEMIYFSSEWVEGHDFLTVATQVDLNTVFKLFVEVLRAVDYLHQRGVLHLDLKPANILVTAPHRTGELSIKLIDFGLARWPRRELASVELEVSGTPPYTAPEILTGAPPTPASDIYALGMLLHELFTGRFPFKSQSPFEIMGEQVRGEAQAVQNLNPALPDRFKEVLEKSVKKRASERYSSVHELLEALNLSLGEHFTLRSVTAPLNILEESDYFFREAELEKLIQALEKPSFSPRLIRGPSGVGKSRFLLRLKETLQLRGMDVLLLESSDSLKCFLQDTAASASVLILDNFECDTTEWERLLSWVTQRGIPVLAAEDREVSAICELTLSPLSNGILEDFLQSEIRDFPIKNFSPGLLAEAQGLPARLEVLLQALREESAIQWTQHGWHWVAPIPPDPNLLFARHKSRWDEIRHRAEQIFELSPLGLDTSMLEGMLHLEPGTLAEKVREWQLAKKYPAQQPSPDINLTPSFHESWLQQELHRLYETDEFEAGAQWARWALTQNSLSLSAPCRVTSARHLVSMSCFEEAMHFLGPSAPEDESWQGLYFEIRARADYFQKRIEEGWQHLEQAKHIYEQRKDFSGQARALNLEGFFLKQEQHFEKSRQAFATARDIAKRAGDPYLESVAAMNLGTIDQDQGDFEAAYQVYQQAFAALADCPHRRHCANLQHNWINLLFHMGRLPEAEAACYQLLQFSIQHRFVENQAAALNYLALMAGKKQNRDLQIRYFEQALDIIPESDRSHLVAQLRVNRGHVLLALESYTPAQLDAEATLAITERNPHSYLRAMALLLKGTVLRKRPKPDLAGAEAHFLEAEALIETSRNRQLQLDVHFEMGLLYKQWGRKHEAHNFLEKTREELHRLLEEMPKELKVQYLRDRKLERIESELAHLS